MGGEIMRDGGVIFIFFGVFNHVFIVKVQETA